jgi:hypothetical protein
MDRNIDALYEDACSSVGQHSKAEVRRTMKGLYLRDPRGVAGDSTGHDWLLAIKAEAERDGTNAMIRSLLTAAFRRDALHDDPISADQMVYCAAVLTTFGPRGLTF